MGRLWFPAIVAISGYYAVFGGEYSALETRGIRVEAERAQAALATLAAARDSLTARAAALEDDARTLETLARESFGMIRDGEVLYRFADSAGDEDGTDEEAEN